MMEVTAAPENYAMNLPPPEICQQLLAFHVLLGSQLPEEKREEFPTQLLALLDDHALTWSDWPRFFAE